jgi:hypothetical protein
MTKLRWDRTNDEKLVEARGAEKVHMGEMPPSLGELAKDIVPEKLKRSLYEFLQKIAFSMVRGTNAPIPPERLRPHIDKYIEAKGGVLGFARWFPDFDIHLRQQKRRLDQEINRRRVRFLRKIANAISRGSTLQSVEFPSEFASEIGAKADLREWAESRPEFAGILRNARNRARHLQKKKSASK